MILWRRIAFERHGERMAVSNPSADASFPRPCVWSNPSNSARRSSCRSTTREDTGARCGQIESVSVLAPLNRTAI